MRKIILLTVFLFLTVITVTGFYFLKIKLPGENKANLINQIPADAALVFEFTNDREFSDLFKRNLLLTSFIGQKKASQLHYLHGHFFKGTVFDNRDIFVSVQPNTGSQNLDILLTVNIDGLDNIQKYFNDNLARENGKWHIENIDNQIIYVINFTALKEAFYLCSKADILAGSFSKNLLISFLQEKRERKKIVFQQLSDQQNKNSIANLYINYAQFPVLSKQLFQNQNNNFFKILNEFEAQAVLSLNYKSDALLFNGYTQTDSNTNNYLQVFLKQQPAINTSKAVYPLNTASAMSFAFENQLFFKTLDRWQNADFKQGKTLFGQIKNETGISIQNEFRKQMNNEFAVITTAENEKLAIIKLKNGSELEPFLQNISLDPDADQKCIKYQNLFFYLLGEPFLDFKQPYFVVTDNYLLLSDTETGLNNYLKHYHHQEFLNKDKQYFNFDELLAAQSNVSFFVHLPNTNQLFKNTLRQDYAKAFQQKNPGWGNYFAMSLQFTGSSNSFYTNFYLQQKQIERDTTAL